MDLSKDLDAQIATAASEDPELLASGWANEENATTSLQAVGCVDLLRAE